MSDIEELRQQGWQEKLEREQERHRMRVESHAQRHKNALELQEIRNQVAAKERREAAEREARRRQSVADLTVAGVLSAFESYLGKRFIFDETGEKVEEPVDREEAKEVAAAILAEAEKAREVEGQKDR